MKIHKIAIVLLALAAAHMLPAKQEQKSNVYRAGDTACMVGDSITAGGWYTANIMLYYASRFPESYVDFRNIGISGDGCHGILWRMDWDILPQLDKNKAVSVLMIGMNDVGRAKFGKAAREKSGEAGLQKKILVTRKNYENRLAQVIDSLSANSRKLIVFTPSIYDQTAEIDSENLFGVNDELVVFGQIGKKLASAKDNAATVDMSKAMLETNAKVQAAEGKDKTIIGKDRVHPAFAGGLVMLEKWLTDLSEPTEVSNIEISANKKAPVRAFNCDISNLAVSKEKISFDALEAALPFAVPADARWILKYTDFQDKFNRQILKITDLPKGSYALKIDGENVGKYSSEELAKGVNLAGNDKTPQYRQAEKLLKKCLQFKNDAAAYRSIFMVELFERRQMPATLSAEEKIAHIEKLYKEKAKKGGKGYVIQKYKDYPANKRKQAQLFENLKKLNAEIYKIAKPVSHKFEIEKI